jgi:hypothetical protein
VTALDVLTLLALGLGIVPLTLFIYFYATVPAPRKWYRRRPSRLFLSTVLGRVVMSQKIALLSILILIVAVRLFGDFPGREWVALGLYTVLVFLFWTVFAVLRRIQKSTESKEEHS